jgi:thiol:disulfide interchange protein
MQRVVLAALIALFAVPAAAQIDSAPKVQARLVTEAGEVAPGGALTVALEQVIRPGWHTYWSNPGEAGLPTTVDWTLPTGWKAGAIEWPYPKRLPVPPLMNYGYEGKVWLLTRLTVPAGAAPGTIVTLKGHASWLVCQEVCIPEDRMLSVDVAVSAAPIAPYATIEEQFADARAKMPTTSPWPVVFHSSDTLDLFVASPTLAQAQLKDATFFPTEEDYVVDAASQQIGTAQNGLVLRLKPAKKAKHAAALSGVLVLTSADGSVQALDVNAKPGAVPAATFGEAASDTGLMLSLLFAFLGGLILNLMPCVLPILAMKALAIARHAQAEKGEAAREGFAYGAGAILSFVALGLALVILRAGGAAIGWGFQLQEPAAVAGFALLIFAVGLNLSGVFEFSGGIAAGDSLARRGGAIGSFFTGVLAVAVAAPCTAPFMAAALGYALTQSAMVSLLVFLALGLGFALPFVLIGLSPALLRLLPKPGAWMLRFKQALAFPMYGAAVWLVWVLTQEAGSNGLILVLGAMIALAFAAWAWNASRNAGPRWRMAGALFAALGLIAALTSLPLIETSAAPVAIAVQTGGIPSEPYSSEKLAQLRAANRPVFVDATAAWCITCLVNEKVALSSAHVRDAFAQKHVAYLVADWTSRNPAITALLEAHGRSGVPLYLYYAPGAADAAVLPQVLTEGEVLKWIGG